MTLQQMEYIVALDKYRHFALAAEHCGITQPTLSAMIQKLENELDIKIFDRSNKSVVPTTLGVKIIRQAQHVVNEAYRVKEIVADETETTKGTLKIGILPTVAPYLVPDFIFFFKQNYPHVELYIDEMKSSHMLDEVRKGSIDTGIGVGGSEEEGLLEIPLFTERFVLYLSEHCQEQPSALTPEMLDGEHMWILKEGHCIKNAAFSFCKSRALGKQIYEAGSIDTLIRIVDRNGGYTIIPELHKAFLTPNQLTHLHDIGSVIPTTHTISLYVRADYIRERMLNAISDTVRQIIPKEMINPHLQKFGIRL